MNQQRPDEEFTSPSTNDDEPAESLRAAGGIVWRRRDDVGGDAELILVHRRRYGGDWTLPKGKLHSTETWQEAALREVREETGCEVALGPFAGAISYPVDDTIKVVRFWHMRCLASEAHPRDDETDAVAWLQPDQARRRMTYDDERSLLDSALAVGLAYIEGWP